MTLFERLQRDNMVCTSELKDYFKGLETVNYLYTSEEHFKNHQMMMHNFGYITNCVAIDPKMNNHYKLPVVLAEYRKSL